MSRAAAALLIIDVQEALCSGVEACLNPKSLVEAINSVSVSARRAGIPVILVQHEEKGSSLERDSKGWQLATNLTIDKQDLLIYKQVGDSFCNTSLDQLLRDKEVDELFICGLQTDYCVNATIRRALQLGYKVKVIEDAHSTSDSETLPASYIIAQHNQVWITLKNGHDSLTTLIKAKDVQF